MYRLILAAAAVGIALLAVNDANSADAYPARDRAALDKLFAAASQHNWTGFYAGTMVGYGWSGRDGGVVGGPTVGYNYQMTPHWVIGTEADWGWSAMSASANGARFINRGLGTVRARVGYLWMPDIMTYATGGLAIGQNSLSVAGFGSDTRFHTGWALGGGVETMLTKALSAKVEYLYTDMGTRTYNVGGIPVPVGGSSNVVRVGLNYKF